MHKCLLRKDGGIVKIKIEYADSESVIVDNSPDIYVSGLACAGTGGYS